MNHTDILKRAFQITWRYRALWIFGFLLALCGGGGGGGGNFNFPGGSGGEGGFGEPGNFDIPEDPTVVIALVVGFVCLVVLLVVIGAVVQTVTRTALIGMVRQIAATETSTVKDGWRCGWSSRAWRIFLLNLLIGIPLFIIAVILILLAVSPLLLLSLDTTPSTAVGIILTIFAVLFVILLFTLIGVVIGPIQELAWRQTALDQYGVMDSLRAAIQLLKRRFKDVAIMWLLMLGVGIGWGLVALFIVLPVSLLAVLLIGGIPAGLVYLISNSWVGAAVTGIPLGLLVLILINTAATGFFLIYQSTVWTLAYLQLQQTETAEQGTEKTPPPEPPLLDLDSPDL